MTTTLPKAIFDTREENLPGGSGHVMTPRMGATTAVIRGRPRQSWVRLVISSRTRSE
jgi:hypothetical protein